MTGGCGPRASSVNMRSASTTERAEGGLKIISHEDPRIDYRVRVTFDASTKHLRKRELIGERETVWYRETYQVEMNPAVADAEFQVAGK